MPVYSTNDSLISHYSTSFFLAVFAAPLFDIIRVVLVRLFKGKSPFKPDRGHLHHILVDTGMTHLLTTLTIMLLNVLVLFVWHITASRGMSLELQFLVVVLAGVVLFWGTFFFINHVKIHNPDRFARWNLFFARYKERCAPVRETIAAILDGNFIKTITKSNN